MLLAVDDVARSLRASWRLMSNGATALPELDLTLQGFVRSYCAAILTIPAMVAVLAAERQIAGFSNAAGLFQSMPLLLAVLASQLAAFFMVPALLVSLVPALLRSPELPRFLIAWNWTEILCAGLFAVPAAVHAIGWSTPVIAAVQWFAFAAIAAKLRYAAAATTFGAERGLAWLVVGASFLAQFSMARLLGLWGF